MRFLPIQWQGKIYLIFLTYLSIPPLLLPGIGIIYSRYLLTHLTVSIDNVLRGRQCRKPHRSSCMEFLCTDPDLSPKAKFKAIGKSCGGIDIDSCCIHFFKKFLSICIISCDDRLGMSGVIAVDMCDCFVDGRNGLNGEDIIEILFSTVTLNSRNDAGNAFLYLFIATDLN